MKLNAEALTPDEAYGALKELARVKAHIEKIPLTAALERVCGDQANAKLFNRSMDAARTQRAAGAADDAVAPPRSAEALSALAHAKAHADGISLADATVKVQLEERERLSASAQPNARQKLNDMATALSKERSIPFGAALELVCGDPANAELFRVAQAHPDASFDASSVAPDYSRAVSAPTNSNVADSRSGTWSPREVASPSFDHMSGTRPGPAGNPAGMPAIQPNNATKPGAR